MNTTLISVLIMLNLSIYLAMPNAVFYPTDNDYDDSPERPISKRFQLSPWTTKRDRTLCDYRLQLRPLPYLSTLCGYSQPKEDIHYDNPFKYG